MAAGPRPADRAPPHGLQRFSIGYGHHDVPGDGAHQGDGDPVVDERRTGAPSQRPRFVPLHDRTGHQHEEGGASGEGGVELLARVELAELESTIPPGLPAPHAQPMTIVGQPPVQPAHVSAQPPAPARTDQTEEQGDGQRQAGVHVDRLHQVPTADGSRERRDVQHGRGDEQHREQDGVGPVHGPLDQIEAKQS
jgi:hypothetical protein